MVTLGRIKSASTTPNLLYKHNLLMPNKMQIVRVTNCILHCWTFCGWLNIFRIRVCVCVCRAAKINPLSISMRTKRKIMFWIKIYIVGWLVAIRLYYLCDLVTLVWAIFLTFCFSHCMASNTFKCDVCLYKKWIMVARSFHLNGKCSTVLCSFVFR